LYFAASKNAHISYKQKTAQLLLKYGVCFFWLFLISFEWYFRNINQGALSGYIALFLKSENPAEILAEAGF